MQKLLVNEGKTELLIVRSFQKNLMSPLLVEFSDGTFGYTTGERVSKESEVSWLPEPHRSRAVAPFAVAEEAEPKEDYSHLPINRLQLLAQSDSEDREELLNIIKEK